MRISFKKLMLVVAMVLSSSFIQAAELVIEVFNPGAKSLFPVSSTLVTGPTEAVLIDAQFQRDDAQSVLKMIKDSGKDLKTIYISHGDPDYYFGLDVILAEYPNANVLASPATLEHINKTVEQKISYWGPILSENAPKETILPTVISGDTITVDGEELKIIGLNGHDPKHTYVWIPSQKTVTGGVVAYEGVHVWMADMKTAQARDNWIKTLDNLLTLNPDKIIPGHVIGDSNFDETSILFTKSYVQSFEDEAIFAKNSAELIEAMKKHYPEFKNIPDLEIGSKVILGEMEW